MQDCGEYQECQLRVEQLTSPNAIYICSVTEENYFSFFTDFFPLSLLLNIHFLCLSMLGFPSGNDLVFYLTSRQGTVSYFFIVLGFVGVFFKYIWVHIDKKDEVCLGAWFCIVRARRMLEHPCMLWCVLPFLNSVSLKDSQTFPGHMSRDSSSILSCLCSLHIYH